MIGLDLVEIDRVAKSAGNPRFLQRVFTPDEQAYATDKPQSLAGMFAAKEAAVKALGVGFVGIRFTDIEVAHKANGMPYLLFHNHAAELMTGQTANLSITHNRTSAAAVVWIEANR